MKFLYKKSSVIPGPGFEEGVKYQPKIPIVLIGPEGELRFEALLDTGSDQTIFPASEVEQVTGIVIDRNIISGVGGRLEDHTEDIFLGKNTKLSCSIDGEKHTWNSNVWFSDDDNSPAILGMSGFFEFFTVTFDGLEKQVEIIANDNFPGKVEKISW